MLCQLRLSNVQLTIIRSLCFWEFTPDPLPKNKDEIQLIHYRNAIPLLRNEKKKQTSHNNSHAVTVFSESLHPNSFSLRFKRTSHLCNVLQNQTPSQTNNFKITICQTYIKESSLRKV